MIAMSVVSEKAEQQIDQILEDQLPFTDFIHIENYTNWVWQTTDYAAWEWRAGVRVPESEYESIIVIPDTDADADYAKTIAVSKIATATAALIY